MTDKPEVLSGCAVRAEIQKEAPSSNHQTWWLLETNWGPHIHYFGPTGGVKSRGGGHIGTEPHEFTKDVNHATRFVTREDAQQFLDWMQRNIKHSWLGWKVTEHEWPMSAEPSPVETGPYLHDRATGVAGVYCIARVRNGTTEFWTGWHWAASCNDMMFDLRGDQKASVDAEWQCVPCSRMNPPQIDRCRHCHELR